MTHFLATLKKQSSHFLFPHVDVKDSSLSGILYIDRKGTRQMFTGKAWCSLVPTAKTEESIFKSGLIEKWAQYVRDVEYSDDRWFGSPAGRI